MFCSKCGKELEEGEKFCSACGERVEKGEVDFNAIASSVSAKAKEGASYAADQIKHIDVSDAKGIFTGVTKKDSIVYLIVGVLLLLSTLMPKVFSVVFYHSWGVEQLSDICSFLLVISLCVYFFISGKVKKGVLSSSQIVLGIIAFCLLLRIFRKLPSFLVIVSMLGCVAIGAILAAVGTIKLCKEMEQSKPVGVPTNVNNTNMTGVPPVANYANVNGIPPIANYDARFDYTPIGMWGYFLYSILFNIPFIGWICWIIFAVGGTRNINLRNFARSYICLYIVSFVFLLIIGLFIAALS